MRRVTDSRSDTPLVWGVRTTDQEMANRRIQFQASGVYYFPHYFLRLDVAHEAAPNVLENRSFVTSQYEHYLATQLLSQSRSSPQSAC
jgi:hypothetical protein